MAFKTILTLLFCFFTLVQLRAQVSKVTLSGQVTSLAGRQALPFVNIVLKTEKDSAFVTGTITNELGRFSLQDVKSGNYRIECVSLGYKALQKPITVGTLSPFLDLGELRMADDPRNLQEVTITG